MAYLFQQCEILNFIYKPEKSADEEIILWIADIANLNIYKASSRFIIEKFENGSILGGTLVCGVFEEYLLATQCPTATVLFNI